jgi:hypothetical protein
MTDTAMFVRAPTFGRDPWLNSSTDPTTVAANHLADAAAGRLYTGEDAIGGDFGLFNGGRDYYASYVDNYGGWGELQTWAKTHAPHAFLLSYTIYGHGALCADVEQYAMTNSDLPGWLDHTAWKDSSGNSWGYTSSGNMGSLIGAAAGRHFIKIGAHYGYGPHICGPHTCGYPQCDWTQWNDVGPGGQNVDQLIGSYLPGSPKPPPAPQKWQPDDELYWCSTWDKQGRTMTPERKARFVAAMDARADLIWKRAHDGSHTATGHSSKWVDWGYLNRGRRFQALWHRLHP